LTNAEVCRRHQESRAGSRGLSALAFIATVAVVGSMLVYAPAGAQSTATPPPPASAIFDYQIGSDYPLQN